jgi:hypothetical protein
MIHFQSPPVCNSSQSFPVCHNLIALPSVDDIRPVSPDDQKQLLVIISGIDTTIKRKIFQYSAQLDTHIAER